MSNIIPLRDFITVRPIDPPKSTSLIVQVKFNEDRIQYGEVVSIGTGVLTPNGQVHPIEVAPGDIVAFDKINAVPVEWKGETLLVLNELSVRAKLIQ